MTVWCFLFHSRYANVLYGGTAPATVYKSAYGGDVW